MSRPRSIRLDKIKKVSFSFSCTQCGRCCREEGFVFFSRETIRKAARIVNLSVNEFTARYLIQTKLGFAHHVKEGSACAFLMKNRCTINDVKPKQCATFPYWTEYVDSQGNLKGFDRKCKGVKTMNNPRSARLRPSVF